VTPSRWTAAPWPESRHGAIVIWIERTYHRRRRQRVLGKLTPIEYETMQLQQRWWHEVL
jgi:putative transposase